MTTQALLKGLVAFLEQDVKPNLAGLSAIGLATVCTAVNLKLVDLAHNLEQSLKKSTMLSSLGFVTAEGIINLEPLKRALLDHVNANGPLELKNEEVSALFGSNINLFMLDRMRLDSDTLGVLFTRLEDAV